MKICRKSCQTEIVEVDGVSLTGNGWIKHLEDGYRMFEKTHWQEVPPEPEWVEVDLKECMLADSGYEVYRPNSTNSLVSTYRGLQIRITEGYVKVSELEEQYGLSTTTHPELFILLRALQRPMLTVWEKKI